MANQKIATERTEMFDSIVHQYDFLNRLFSLRMDVLWRKKVVRILKKKQPQTILDLASGTCDLSMELSRLSPQKIIAMDPSAKMLEKGVEKIAAKGLKNTIVTMTGSAENIPLEDGSVDAVTISFGIRNFNDLSESLQEIKRVLTDEGSLVVLEMMKPTNWVIKYLFGFYFRHLLPRIARIWTKQYSAYDYLPKSVHNFLTPKELSKKMDEAGFRQCQYKNLSLGIVTVLHAQK